jgi:hypothetical protein
VPGLTGRPTEPPLWVFWLMFVLALGLSGGLALYLVLR